MSSVIWPQGLTVVQAQAVLVLTMMTGMVGMIVGMLVAMWLERRVR